MFSDLSKALEVLYKRKNGSKPRLNHVLKMLSDLGNPQNPLKVIHVLVLMVKARLLIF